VDQVYIYFLSLLVFYSFFFLSSFVILIFFFFKKGATNMVTAMQDALMDGTPLIVLSGQVTFLCLFFFSSKVLEKKKKN